MKLFVLLYFDDGMAFLLAVIVFLLVKIRRGVTEPFIEHHMNVTQGPGFNKHLWISYQKVSQL